MIAADYPRPQRDAERILFLLDRLDTDRIAHGVIADAGEISRLLSLYSFRFTRRAERLCAELSSRYRPEILSLYGDSFLLRRQSDSCYLRLEQMLSLLARVAALRLCRAGVLALSSEQLRQSDGMLLRLAGMQTKKEQERG